MLRFNQATLGINRYQEQHILKLIRPLKISPTIIENNPDSGYLISAYIPQATWHHSDFINPKKLKALSQVLNQVHQIPYQYLPSRLDHRLKNYLQQIKGVPEGLKNTLLHSIEQLEGMNFWQANNTLYHSDLNPSNILGIDPIQIIDWEYAGQGHPLLDWLIIEHYAGYDLSEYYPADLQEEWLKPAKTMIDAMMQLWSLQSS